MRESERGERRLKTDKVKYIFLEQKFKERETYLALSVANTESLLLKGEFTTDMKD